MQARPGAYHWVEHLKDGLSSRPYFNNETRLKGFARDKHSSFFVHGIRVKERTFVNLNPASHSGNRCHKVTGYQCLDLTLSSVNLLKWINKCNIPFFFPIIFSIIMLHVLFWLCKQSYYIWPSLFLHLAMSVFYFRDARYWNFFVYYH
jgi:hypothetical protein